MRINPDTLLFEDLDFTTKMALTRWAEAVVLRGDIPTPDPEPIQEWFRVAKQRLLPSSPRLLTLSTVLPQKVLLSLVQDYGTPKPNRTEWFMWEEVDINPVRIVAIPLTSDEIQAVGYAGAGDKRGYLFVRTDIEPNPTLRIVGPVNRTRGDIVNKIFHDLHVGGPVGSDLYNFLVARDVL